MIIIISCSDNYPQSDIENIKSLIHQFCVLDLSGYRLSSNTYDKMSFYIDNAEESCWETGWDLFTIIDSFKIDKVKKIDNNRYDVHVTFKNIVKDFNESTPIKIDNKDEKIIITVIKVDNTWKISKDSCYHPHVSLQTTLDKIKAIDLNSKYYEKNEIEIIKKNIEILDSYADKM